MFIFAGLVESARDHAGLIVGIRLVAQLMQVFWSLVWIRFALGLYDARAFRPRELLPDAKTYLEFLAVSVLFGLLVAAGLVLLVVPGIYLAVRYGLATFLVADDRAAVLDSFRESSALTKGARWSLLLLMLLLFVFNLAGSLLLGLGLLLTVPTSVFAMAYVYRRLLAARVERETPPFMGRSLPTPA
jgi:uncharacterized membrane protein